MCYLLCAVQCAIYLFLTISGCSFLDCFTKIPYAVLASHLSPYGGSMGLLDLPNHPSLTHSQACKLTQGSRDSGHVLASPTTTGRMSLVRQESDKILLVSKSLLHRQESTGAGIKIRAG